MIPPVLGREMRSAGRYWGTYWIRVLAGAGMLAGLVLLLVANRFGGLSDLASNTAGVGSLIFLGCHLALVGMMAWVCPLLTADCISRERREGTLGLLFLTPLDAWDVVLGKGTAQVLRAFGLWMSAVPFLAVPFLLGGVLPADFCRAVAVELSVVLLGLAAGFAATVCATRWASAMLSAMAWSLGFWLVALAVCGVVAMTVMASNAPTNTSMPPSEAWLVIPFAILLASPASGAVAGVGGTVPTWVTKGVDASLAAVLGFAVVLFLASVLVAGRVLDRQRRAGRGGRSERTRGRGWRPGLRGARRWLDENPVRWLQAWSPLIRWGLPGWVVVVGLLWGATLGLGRLERSFEVLGWWIAPALMLAMALSSAASFRQEIEEGTLELLLVTTLPPRMLVTGRARALWATFGPALWLLLAGQFFMNRADWTEDWLVVAGISASSWLTLPMVGMRCAMRRLHPLVGLVLVLGWGVVAPMALAGVLTWWMDAMSWPSGMAVWASLTVVCQLVASLWWGRMTAWDLATRHFMKRPLQRARA